MPRTVLVVEDDADIAGLLTLHLQDIDCTVHHAGNGDDGLDMALSNRYDLLLLDLMLPGLDGLEVCRQLRSASVNTPILMLTAKSSELERIVGLELGADDYLAKPFSYTEVQARVKAIFRRMDMMRAPAVADDDSRLLIDELIIDPGSRSVSVAGQPIELTATEFKLLTALARRPGRVQTRGFLLQEVWDLPPDLNTRTVDTHVSRLRKKLALGPSSGWLLNAVYQHGYRLEHSSEDDTAGGGCDGKETD